MFSHFFIDRPIFACVVCLVITLLGAISIPMLPIEQLPDIVPPTISVSATYPGASAQDVINAVAIPLEEALNGVDNMIYMNTSATSNGTMNIAVTFAVGTDPDIASVLVQNRAKSAEPLLPEEVRRQGIRVNKRGGEVVCIITLFEKIMDAVTGSDKKIGDEKSVTESKAIEGESFGGGISGALNKDGTVKNLPAKGTKTGQYLANYASLYLRDRLARVKGVGEITMFDRRQFSMRIWLDEDAMSSRGLSVQEIQTAIAEQNRQVAAGRIGVEPVPTGIQNNLAVVTLGRLQDVSQFENMILRADEQGGVLRLKDVALIELGSADYTSEARFNGRMATGIAVAPQAGANVLDIAERITATMESLEDTLARSGLEYSIPFDATDFVEETVKEFWETLILCVIFVVVTIYIFLQDWRAALIPILTIPVSIVGTFFLIWCFGFSINTMTLFGLILVIGIVVDDAIVVVENTQRIIDEEGIDPHTAVKKSMIQIIGPVVAMVLIMMAVFLPTSMMQGIVGKLYKQFALTIAGAIAISGICGVTLAPALCGILLRPSIPKNKRFVGFRIFNFFFDSFGKFYLATVKTMIWISPLVLIAWFALVGALIYCFSILPQGFLPNEDQGVMFAEIRLPEGASMQRTSKILDRVEKIVAEERTIRYGDEYYERGILKKLYERFWDKKKSYVVTGGVKSYLCASGFSFGSGQASNLGMIVIALDSWDDRRAKDIHIPGLKNRMDEGLRVGAIKARLEAKFNEIPEAQFRVDVPPPVQVGIASGVDYVLLDERGVDPTEMAKTRDDLVLQAVGTVQNSDPIIMAFSSFNPNSPQIYLDIDRDKAMRMGIRPSELYAALQTYLGSTYVNDFNILGRTFRVNMQAKGEYRGTINDILRIKVKNSNGEMVPIEAFTKPVESSGPQRLTRYNMFPSVGIIGIVNPFRSSGDAIKKMEELSQTLPDGYSYDWTGLTYQEKSVGSQTAIFFAVSVLFTFLILAAQYESWSSPLIIMMAVPLGVAGSLTAVVLFSLAAGALPDINLYTQIGLLMMVGLSAKNAVLITEFARDRREKGGGLVQSAYEAGRLRLRPIFMTSFAFILGVTPLVWADGAGGYARNAIGNGVFGGLLMETFAGVYVTPVLFVIIQGTAEICNKRIQAFLHYSRAKAQRHMDELDESTIRHGD